MTHLFPSLSDRDRDQSPDPFPDPIVIGLLSRDGELVALVTDETQPRVQAVLPVRGLDAWKAKPEVIGWEVKAAVAWPSQDWLIGVDGERIGQAPSYDFRDLTFTTVTDCPNPPGLWLTECHGLRLQGFEIRHDAPFMFPVAELRSHAASYEAGGVEQRWLMANDRIGIPA